ncbi:hypothetical protein MIMGU_mgv1a0093072mg, partial [Erythranthe guttata]
MWATLGLSFFLSLQT